jgi:hypothetical protein
MGNFIIGKLVFTNYFRVIKSKKMKQTRHVPRMGDKYTILVGKAEGKRPIGGPMLRFEDNSEVNPQDIGCKDVN